MAWDAQLQKTLQCRESFYAKKITMKQLMSHETVLYATEDGFVKAVRIMTNILSNPEETRV
jgi:predicted transcriptional regulator